MKEFLEFPLRNLARRPTRSIITMLGVIIGVTAIISLTAMGDGLRAGIDVQFQRLGSQSILVMPGSSFSAIGMISSVMTRDDINKIKSVRGVEAVSDFYIYSTRACFAGKCKTIPIYLGEDAEVYDEKGAWEIEHGRIPDESERNKIAVGPNFGKDNFDKEIRLGDRIRLDDKPVEIVGIFVKTGDPHDDRAAVLNGVWAKEFYGLEDVSSMAYVFVLPAYDPEEVAARMKAKLEKGTDLEYTTQTSADLLGQVDSMMDAVTWVFLGIASISILVGGIGIMNTMYMSTRERTREIGVMKAIGATRAKIRELIIIEAGLLGASGGIIGTFCGWFVAEVASSIARSQSGHDIFYARVTPQLVLFALIFSFTVGTISGYLPASAASKLSPVEALRYE